MSICGFDRDSFIEQLNAALSPSHPIDSIEHLFGRGDEFSELEKALSMEGRHVFIYGDRGVGKSSLAATIAHQFQSSDNAPITVSGSPDETFSSILRNIVTKATGGPQLEKTSVTRGYRGGFNGVTSSKSTSTERVDFSKAEYTISDAVAILRAALASYSRAVVVLIDEFDRIPEKVERNKFADLLKHLGDARIPCRFIFTGVGASLDDLLGAHGSAIRQLHTKELSRLSYDGRWDIAIAAAESFGLELPESIYIRIAQISDGFPYYVHLIMEKVLWRAFEHSADITQLDWNLFHLGLRDAINSINADLKRPYEVVLRQRTQDYEPVLWATADSEELHRSIHSYYGSYLRIMEERREQPINETQFRYRIKKLMSEDLGPILKKDWYQSSFYVYQENMLRGFVRMQAEANNVELRGEEVKVPRQYMHTPARANSGYRGPTVPSGVEFAAQERKQAKKIGD